MAIDAIIAWTHETDDGLVLELVPRDSSAGPAGQERLTIIGPRTSTPRPGQVIWGNSHWLQIPGTPSRFYARVGYRRVREVITQPPAERDEK